MTDVATIDPKPRTADDPPHEVIWKLTNAVAVARCIHVVAELGVADHIADQAVSVVELASACGADPDALDRVLRLLVSHGVFQHRAGAYAHTEPSRLLREDHPMSMRAFPRMMGMPIFLASFANLDHSVRTGSPGLDLVDSKGLWSYLEDHPAEARLFDQAMAAKAHADVAAVLGAYDFSPHRRIADIGGGRGHLITAILGAYEDVCGILFDLPNVTRDVLPTPRLDVVAGDYFSDPLPACDAYILMNIIHDWGEEQAATILGAISKAGRSSGATVLLIETVMPQGPEPHWAKTLDVIMLDVTGGRERTQAEYDRLFDAAGMTPVRTIPTRTPFSIIEAHVPSAT